MRRRKRQLYRSHVARCVDASTSTPQHRIFFSTAAWSGNSPPRPHHSNAAIALLIAAMVVELSRVEVGGWVGVLQPVTCCKL